MPDPVISRTAVIWGLIVLLLSLLFCGSLLSWMTGVYGCPAVAVLDGSTGYLVRHDGGWFIMSINGSGGPQVSPVDPAEWTVTPGIWMVEVKNKGGEISGIPAFSVMDVYHIRRGKYRHLLPQANDQGSD